MDALNENVYLPFERVWFGTKRNHVQCIIQLMIIICIVESNITLYGGEEHTLKFTNIHFVFSNELYWLYSR